MREGGWEKGKERWMDWVPSKVSAMPCPVKASIFRGLYPRHNMTASGSESFRVTRSGAGQPDLERQGRAARPGTDSALPGPERRNRSRFRSALRPVLPGPEPTGGVGPGAVAGQLLMYGPKKLY